MYTIFSSRDGIMVKGPGSLPSFSASLTSRGLRIEVDAVARVSVICWKPTMCVEVRADLVIKRRASGICGSIVVLTLFERMRNCAIFGSAIAQTIPCIVVFGTI